MMHGGVDVGGTFTDALVIDRSSSVPLSKFLTTPGE
jgi:N-methylhydantoinase A/oxoprolinase/acetone carboxylase beta subunit